MAYCTISENRRERPRWESTRAHSKVSWGCNLIEAQTFLSDSAASVVRTPANTVYPFPASSMATLRPRPDDAPDINTPPSGWDRVFRPIAGDVTGTGILACLQGMKKKRLNCSQSCVALTLVYSRSDADALKAAS